MTAAAAILLSGARSASVADYFALLKPRVMSLVLFTAVAGMLIAPGHIDPFTGFSALLCIAVGAGAAGALNMAYDSDIDPLMARTATRPIPMGRISRGDALAFGWTLAVGAVALMGLFVNPLAAFLLAFSIGFYVFVYTLWLKRRTPQNIVIGGLSGSLPPAIGWAAATGSTGVVPLLLVLIIFLWTPPHFWALSLYRSQDYARAGVPMLPVVKGKRATRWHILLYTLVLVPLGLVPAFIGLGGPLYAAIAVGFGGWFAIEAVCVLRETDEAHEPAARRLFGVSILYLFVLFAGLILEHLTGLPPLTALSFGGWA
ncbi:MAG TPA: heme o synthase [Rhizomicrobium sp.]|jgi:protoheme IX farnesyltransferase|nr:heme o synthase [Rhizomicrobium sp.]